MTTCLIVGFVALKIAQYYFVLYPYISFFFFVMGSVSIFSMLTATKRENRKYFNTFMIVKMIKLFSIIIAVALYAMFIRDNMISFLLTFFAYYLIYSIFEAYISMKLNKEGK